MDISRSILDNLMGRDRNLPKDSTLHRDHYSNPDVCKPFLICFCFNTLFPNTIYDEGPCNKRHDTYLKTMFDNDLNRGEHQKQYIKECIAWIERRLQQVQQKTKKNQSTIDGKSSLSTERPRQLLDRILAIDNQIEEMMRQAAIFGQNGQIDDSSRCLEEVERLRQHRKQVDLMGDNLLAVAKHQKICEVCGAIQTINDTQKRIQMHLQGKIHQGFLRLRTEIQTLKIRLEIVQQKIDRQREKNKPLAISQGQNQIPDVKIEKNHSYEKIQERERQPKEKLQRDSPSKKKKKQHKHKDERSRSKQKKKKQHDYDRYDRHQRSRSKDKHRKKEKKKKQRSHDRRSRSYQREHRRHYG